MDLSKKYVSELKKAIDSISLERVEEISEILAMAYRTNKSIFM